MTPPGALVLPAVAVLNVLLWIIARPNGEPSGRYIGEICGVEAVLLFSCTLVLATLLPFIEAAFGGLDRVVVWHRRTAVAGVLLLIPHLALVTSPNDPLATSLGKGLGIVALLGLSVLCVWALAPSLRAARWPGPVRRLARATYERWLTAHRLTGLFVATAVVHGAIVDPVLRRSTLLRVVFLVVGGIGIAAYLYRELFARYVVPIYDYTVGDVRRLNESTLEVALEPARARLEFRAGQFVFLAFGGFGGWERHPFSVSGAPAAHRLEVTIKAVGDYTHDLYGKLRPGVPAKIAGPFGTFDYRLGGHDQVWIAGGIGITPFLSWVRALDDDFDRTVELYYAVARAGDALYLDEITTAAARHPSLTLHVVDTEHDGQLGVEDVMRHVPVGVTPWVYMCGPPVMMDTFARGLRRQGVPGPQIRWERFQVR